MERLYKPKYLQLGRMKITIEDFRIGLIELCGGKKMKQHTTEEIKENFHNWSWRYTTKYCKDCGLEIEIL